MPGIVGLITKMPRASAESQLRRMLAAVQHDPALRVGIWSDESMGVYVGWTARKGSFADGMPLTNNDSGATLIFSGEEYSGVPSGGAAERNGHGREIHGPSCILREYEKGSNFPAALNGRFQGLVADRNRRTATLFNDRYGIHRLYYHESKNSFYFAGEAKAILAVRPELRSVDARSLGELVSCGCVLENRTLFQQMFVLPPASAWVFRNGLLEHKRAYFDPAEWENQQPLDEESYYQALREVFSRRLPCYFQGQEKIALSLTGGLDTRMILAWHDAAPNTLPCYTFGGMIRDSHDVRVARKVARACKQPFEVIEVGKEFLKNFPDYAERSIYLSDGCAAVRHAADLYVNERIARIAPVRMTGNYGSEVLRRLAAFKPQRIQPGLFSADFLPQIQTAESTYARTVQGHALTFIAFRQTPWHHYGLLGLEQTQLFVRSPFLDNEVVKVAFRAPEAKIERKDVFEEKDGCVRLIGDGSSVLRQIPTDRGLAGPPGSLFVKFLRAWLEFTFKAEYAYDYGMPQWVAKIDHFFSPLHLERLFLGRHKFAHFRVWYRDALSGYVRDMLLDSRTLSRPYLNRQGVESIVRGHLKGDRNYTTEIHQLLTLELVNRLLVEEAAPVASELAEVRN